MTHTPGPWAVNSPCSDEVVADLGGADLIVARSIRTAANAALIAAAPDLLEALRGIVCLSIWRGASDFDRRRVDDARAAIAKATLSRT